MRSLRSGGRIFERHGRYHALLPVTDTSQEGPAAFVRVSGAGMFHHLRTKLTVLYASLFGVALLLVTLLACLGPALRAGRADPVGVLRAS